VNLAVITCHITLTYATVAFGADSAHDVAPTFDDLIARVPAIARLQALLDSDDDVVAAYSARL
jgi:hypothetical protein